MKRQERELYWCGISLLQKKQPLYSIFWQVFLQISLWNKGTLVDFYHVPSSMHFSEDAVLILWERSKFLSYIRRWIFFSFSTQIESIQCLAINSKFYEKLRNDCERISAMQNTKLRIQNNVSIFAQALQNITKYYKILQNITKYYKILQNITK